MTGKVTLRRLQAMKAAGDPIVALGVYDAVAATVAERVGIDVVMTGPSGPMALFGHSNPAAIPFHEQIMLLQSVSRTVTRPLIVAHLPFLGAATAADALAAAKRLLVEGGAEAVKLDATKASAPVVAALVAAGIPVMAHVGMQASRKVLQSGYGLRGATAEEAKAIMEDCRALAEAGAFAFLAEMIPGELCAHLAAHLAQPVIGLGSGPHGDGSCIIAGDALGFVGSVSPANAGRFADISALTSRGLADYAAAARDGSYPTEAQTPRMNPAQAQALAAALKG